MHTHSAVTDQAKVIHKTSLARRDDLDQEHAQQGKYVQGFKLTDTPGGQLLVLGLLDAQADLQQVESILARPA